MAAKTSHIGDTTILSISALPKNIDEEYIQIYFTKNCEVRGEVKVSFNKDDNTAVAFIKPQLDSEGT